MHRTIFDFIMVGVYILLVVAFGTIAVLFVRESARLKPIDKRVAGIARVLFFLTLALALDSLYWAIGQSGRIGFLPLVGQTFYRSHYIFIPKTGLFVSAVILWYLLHRREIPELGKETEEARRMRILHKITDSTTRSLDLTVMLNDALPQMLELMAMEYAAVYIRNRRTGELELAATYSSTNEPYAPVAGEERSEAVTNAAQASAPTLQAASRLRNTKDWSSTTVYIPLLALDHSAGVVILSSRTPRVFGQKDMDLLLAVGSQMAVSIENALLFRQNQSLLTEVTKSADGLARTVEERTQMLHIAQEQLGLAEMHKRQFYKDTVLAVTAGKLVIVEPEELPEINLQPLDVCELSHKEDIGRVRRALRQIALESGMSRIRTDNLLLAAGEAMTNAVKHGEFGIVRVYRSDTLLHIAIEDHGPGIDALTLPKATLLRGYSTKPSLGMGYALILELADKVYLSTGPTGTIVVLEMAVQEPDTELTLDVIPDTWSQF